MTGHLLFVLMCCCHEIQVQASPPPKLTVNPTVISETESVTLDCRPPSYLSVSQCNFDFGGHVRVPLCLQTLTGTELLHISHQSSPAEIKVKCFYIEKLQDINSPSPHSDISSIIINSSTTSVSPSPRSVTSAAQKTSKIFTGSKSQSPTSVTTTAQTSGKIISGSTVVMSQSPTSVTNKAKTDKIVSDSTTSVSPSPRSVTSAVQKTGSTVGMTQSPTSITLTTQPSGQIILDTKVVTGVGVTVGVILLGMVLFCAKRRTGRCFNKREQVNSTVGSSNTGNLDDQNLLPTRKDETYSVITSVPGADCPAGTEKMNKEDQNFVTDEYHLYSTISEDNPPSAPQGMIYSTLQLH